MTMSTGSVPVPDPTKLTTDAVNAATMQWRRDLEGLREIFETRLHANDKAVLLHAEKTEQLSDRGEERNTNLSELFDQKVGAVGARISDEVRIVDEKFNSIEQQFVERDVRTEQQAGAGAQALAAALQAAKELVGAQGEASAAAAVKSETSFTKQIDQIGTIISTLEKALDGRITELKERIDRGEGSNAGSQQARNDNRDQRTDTRLTINSGMAVFAGLISVITIVMTILFALKK